MTKPAAALALNWTRGLTQVSALATLVCAFTAGSAQAAVYTGVWDPAYGAPFTNLGWRGSAHYAVPNACEPAGTADINNLASCGGAAVVTSAEVEFYDVTAGGQPTLATLVFDPLSMFVGTLRYLDGELAQLTTSASNAVNPTANLSAFGVASTAGFFLQFSLDGPHLGWIDCGPESDGCNRGSNDSVNFAPRFSISRDTTAVPEPGSLWLSGLALVALCRLRRAKV